MTLTLKRLFDFSLALCGYLLAVAMFFCFPGVESWTLSAFRPISDPALWICGLLVLLVVLPALFGPSALVARSRGYARAVLAGSCLTLALLFTTAALGTPLLYARVALLALLTGQLLALGRRSPQSVPYNWMVYLAFALANFTFPDGSILAGANFLAGAYLLTAGILLLKGTWTPGSKKKGYRVMVG